VKDVEFAEPAGTLGLDVHSLEQIRIAFWIKDDRHFASTYILGDEHLCKAGLADASRAEYQGMANPLAKWKRNLNLVWLYAVEARAPSDRREGAHGIAPNIPARQLRQQTYGERRPLKLFLQPSCEEV